ncbi:helix-turn-helix transcriptional regulator [Rhodococcus sp. ABRD24]|nr:helix-turn-helix transcriptional regulator [Rhodococcus sp. ABRD24]
MLHLHDRLHVVLTARDTSVFGDPGASDVDHVVISPSDLLFTPDESHNVLKDRGVDLPPHLLELVQDVTGGFPPLVRAAATVARPFDSDYAQNRELARLALERSIDRYVDREILGDPELAERRELIFTASAARVLTEAALTALTGDDDAARHLRALESAGVLSRSLWPNDDEWQFPRAIRESLMRTVRLESPAGPLRAPGELARWFLSRQEPAQALVHALDAHDWELAMSTLRSNWAELVSQHFQLVREALLLLPADIAEGEPSISAGRELFLRLGSDLTRFPESTPVDADALEALGRTQDASDALAVSSVQSLILRVSGNFAQASELSIRLATLGDTAVEFQNDAVADFLPLLRLQWGITHQLHGNLTRASMEFRRAFTSNRPAGTDFIARNAAGSIALNYALAGELTHAESWLEKEQRYEDASTWISSMVRVGGLVAGALVALDRMEVHVAAKILADLGDLPDDEELWAFAVYAHCQLALVSGTAEQGLDRLHRATAVYDRWFTPCSVAAPLLAAAEAELLSALGQGNEARAAIEGARGQGPWTTIARARVDLSSGNPASALADCARAVVSDCPHPRVRMESALIQAAAHLDLSNKTRARAMLQRAVALSGQTGLVRPYASQPAGRIAQLSELEVALPENWLTATPPPDRAVFPDVIKLIQISDRESAVLAALTESPAVADIAARLYVSQNTVKSQLRSLYRKLGVHSRADALTTAIKLGLLSSGHDADA